MSKWISIDERLPDKNQLTKFKVKILVGSVKTKEIESIILGKNYPTGFRFIVGDWQRVTHWQPIPLLPEEQ